jgi:hypothetical protein
VALDASGEVYVTVGSGGPPENRDLFGPEGANLGQLVHVNSDGTWENVADIAAYEAANNPTGDILDSNPFGIEATDSGFIIADAGANDVLELTMAGGNLGYDISVLAILPTRTIEFPPGNDFPMHQVPTALAEDSAGNVVLGQLTGFPFPVGGAYIYDLPGTPEPPVRHMGFTTIIDTLFDGADNLYVLEMWTNGLPETGDITGSLKQAAGDDNHITVFEQPCQFGKGGPNITQALCFPTGMTHSDGSFYISNMGIASTVGGASGGVVVRLDVAPTSITLDSLTASSRSMVPALLAFGAFTLAAGALVVLRRRVR